MSTVYYRWQDAVNREYANMVADWIMSNHQYVSTPLDVDNDTQVRNIYQHRRRMIAARYLLKELWNRIRINEARNRAMLRYGKVDTPIETDSHEPMVLA